MNKCQLVRKSCQKVISNAKHVKINYQNIDKFALRFNYTQFNQFDHHNISDQNQEQILKYLLMLDSLNFCFWPLQGFQYEHLADNVKKYIQANPGNDALAKLSQINGEQLKQNIFNNVDVPLADQRARIIRQMSNTVLHKFNGSIKSIIQSSQKSSVKLLDILTQNFPNFQDHSIYKGSQIHFYKRAQIFIGDIFAKFQGKGIGQFNDIHQLTMFPDYRVPQILNQWGILEYSSELQNKVIKKIPIPSGSQQQIQIRAFSVYTVELMKEIISKNKGKNIHSIQVDWFLWEEGEKNLKQIKPHHRTLTIYY